MREVRVPSRFSSSLDGHRNDDDRVVAEEESSFSPTAFGMHSLGFPEPLKPMFPDARRDEYMSKSTSSKATDSPMSTDASSFNNHNGSTSHEGFHQRPSQWDHERRGEPREDRADNYSQLPRYQDEPTRDPRRSSRETTRDSRRQGHVLRQESSTRHRQLPVAHGKPLHQARQSDHDERAPRYTMTQQMRSPRSQSRQRHPVMDDARSPRRRSTQQQRYTNYESDYSKQQRPSKPFSRHDTSRPVPRERRHWDEEEREWLHQPRNQSQLRQRHSTTQPQHHYLDDEASRLSQEQHQLYPNRPSELNPRRQREQEPLEDYTPPFRGRPQDDSRRRAPQHADEHRRPYSWQQETDYRKHWNTDESDYETFSLGERLPRVRGHNDRSTSSVRERGRTQFVRHDDDHGRGRTLSPMGGRRRRQEEMVGSFGDWATPREVKPRSRTRSPVHQRYKGRDRRRSDMEAQDVTARRSSPRAKSRRSANRAHDLGLEKQPRVESSGSERDESTTNQRKLEFLGTDESISTLGHVSSFDSNEASVGHPSSRAVVRGRTGRWPAKKERSRSRSRSKSKGRKSRKKPAQFVIDIPDMSESEREVTFSPSTDAPADAPQKNRELEEERAQATYMKRLADANLMKEQSEARHQILREVRQAMEMRDMATDVEDKMFWDRQITTLNESLKKLCAVQNTNERPLLSGASILTPPRSAGSDRHTPRSPSWSSYEQAASAAERFNKRTSPTPSAVEQLLLSSPPNLRRETAPRLTSPSTYSTVKAQAPDNLPEGHQFTIRMNGRVLKAKVPAGGVRKGDIFSIRIPVDDQQPKSHISPAGSVKVRAPAALPEGYRFTAKMGNRTIVATVPPGGVEKGQIFSVAVQSEG